MASLASYGQAVAAVRAIKSVLAHIGPCEYFERGEHWYDGVPRCRQSGADIAEWCDACAAAEHLRGPLAAAKRTLRGRRRSVDRMAVRQFEGRT